MKKLMTLIAATAVAGIAGAAQVNWSVTGVSADPVGTAYNGYSLFLCDASVYTASALATDLAEGDFSKLSADGFVQATAGTVQQGKTEFAKIASAYKGGDYAAGDEKTFYTLVLNTTGDASLASWFTISADIKKDVPSSGALQMSFANLSAGAQTAWTATPEPTSGMLLLFGVAGLALRRKQDVA